ncbi:unnamed protein product [Heterobilharzia americana]|nr:unnamed protein product [Heterobilharzia americana]CAH8590057.1 unnamed protein product [Heterobilharzia americana]
MIDECNCHTLSNLSVMLTSKSNNTIDENSDYISESLLNKTCLDICKKPMVDPIELESDKGDNFDGIIDLSVKQGDSFARCLCSLIVLLVCMQLVVGVASTGVGLFLTWKVPELQPMECAYFSGMPLIISGLIGTFICFRHRFPSFSPQFINIIQVVSSIFSFICFIICLVTSVYAGQKGSLIASYDNTCRIPPISHRQNTEENENKTKSSQTKNDNFTLITNYSNILNFIEPCCYEILKNTCQCFTTHGECIASYNNLPCRLLFSSIKDYIILQSALMAVGSGVSLWSWLILIENKLKNLLKNKYARLSFSSTRSSVPETSISPMDERTSSIDLIETIDTLN